MDINRLSLGEKIAAASGVLLLIVMFLDWFGISSEDADESFEADLSADEIADLTQAAVSQGLTDGTGTLSLNAWQSFSFIDIILLLAAVAAIGFAVAKAASQSVRLPVPSSAIIAGLGILATLLVIYRLIDPPYGLNREIFAFLGLLASAAIAYGGYQAMQEEGTSFQEVGDTLRDRGGPGDGTGGTGGGGARGTGTPPPPPPPPAAGR